MALLDVNALVALAWDSHVHHGAIRAWFADNSRVGWATCPITESGFLRASSNPKVLPSAITVEAASSVLLGLREQPGHRFLSDDVSVGDRDVPAVLSYRQLTDAHLLALARRRGVRLVTFDATLLALGGEDDVELLSALEPQAA